MREDERHDHFYNSGVHEVYIYILAVHPQDVVDRDPELRGGAKPS